MVVFDVRTARSSLPKSRTTARRVPYPPLTPRTHLALTKQEILNLVNHVGCGDLDSMIGCERCAAIRECLYKLAMLED